jgi:AcrR family transcriptional regulator
VGAVHLGGVIKEDASPSNGCASGCFSDCPTCRRLRKAAVAVAIRHGVAAATSEAIAERAEVPLERAVQHYPAAEDCLAAAYDEGALLVRRICARILPRSGSWQERLRDAVDAAFEEFKARPELARFCTVEAWRSDLPMLCASRLAARERLVSILAEESGAGDEDLPGLRFEILVGAAHHMVSEQIQANGGARSVRERVDQVIDLFEPVRVPTAS